jgi:hypothetical protein
MRLGKLLGLAAITAATALAAPARADVDTDFADQLHGYGNYSPRDYNAWPGNITCNRLGIGADTDADTSRRRSRLTAVYIEVLHRSCQHVGNVCGDFAGLWRVGVGRTEAFRVRCPSRSSD